MIKLHRDGNASELKTIVDNAASLGVTVNFASGTWVDDHGRHGTVEPFTVSVSVTVSCCS